MDFFDVLLQSGLITAAIVTYLIFFRRASTKKGNYRKPGWNYPLKLVSAWYAVKRWKWNLTPMSLDESPHKQTEGWDAITFRTTASDGTTILLGTRKLCGRRPVVEATVHIKLSDGTIYKLPQHPDTIIGHWETYENGWIANGLKIQILEAQTRVRILYNGLLRRVGDDVIQHVRFNFLWTSASSVMRYPDDLSEELAAEALAIEPWRDGKWSSMLGKWEDGSWLQFGAIQGRFQSYDKHGVSDKSEYMRTRGVKERSWAPHGYEGVRRSVTITAAAKDGTLLQLRGMSYRNVLTQCFSGSVRFPNYKVGSVTSTDLVMSEFCETADEIPKVYTINVSTKNRSFRVVLRINDDGGRLFSGVPYGQEIVYRTMIASIDEFPGTGILELGYEPTVTLEPPVRLRPLPVLRWLDEKEAGEVNYCVSFKDRAATCPNYVGGKGASLALLASVQREEGYRVPPGYCLTTRALDKHLEMNPELKAAIREIEAVNERYDEKVFKEKCAKSTNLFAVTEITGDVRDEILSHLNELRIEAMEQNLGPELRFAVRSSAVGEDSEVLSAAGQNETILGCVSDDDVLRGIQKCWGSMFAFISAHYRRQNGQTCLCGGGVVVQALVPARAAGVMFTRHPDAGDPTRLLITANYGLGESVVSGSVEPDTITVTRHEDGSVSITKIELGAKKKRVTAASKGVAMEDVPESDRIIPCLTESEAMRLAQIGVSQEELWGAGRDIEWAISTNDIFLLQARPITSLERWTEEELLHELDFPIMSDDELITFANTGEVMPKPLSAITYDLIVETLGMSMMQLIPHNNDGYDKFIVLSHNRCGLVLYNLSYKMMSKLDLNTRMMEMSVHGHTVADEHILSTALHRRKPGRFDLLTFICLLINCLFTSKMRMNRSMKRAKEINVDTIETNDPLELLDIIATTNKKLETFSYDHSMTSTASTGSQIIAMSVLLEGKSDFTPEQCNEIGKLLSCVGDVLSAEVPVALANLARQLEESGRVEEFRAQDPKKAMDWLKKNLPHIHLDVCVFLEQHGHRAIMEFDLATLPWALAPEELMKIMQSLRSSQQEKESKTDAQIIDSLTTPKKSSTRKALRWLLPLCRRSIRHREGTKAHLILAIHKLRLALIRLGRMMVKQWYLPEHELVFFFRFFELRNYLKTRDPALLRKALQRRQYYPGWCKLQFAEINTGWLEPLKTTAPTLIADDVKMKATSVCGGEAVARACVVKHLSEIDQLQRGDILITHSTDIGWSPYFTLVTGIVTELGGLISHGAVIAREYGLPCIVGATNATNIFKTGDLVRLSGTEAVIERVQMADKPILNGNSKI